MTQTILGRLNGASPEDWDNTNKAALAGLCPPTEPNDYPEVVPESEWNKMSGFCPPQEAKPHPNAPVVSDGRSTSYYEIPEDTYEIQDLIEHKGMSFAQGNIFKAAYRLGGKAGSSIEYDLNKIIWFAERMLEEIRE